MDIRNVILKQKEVLFGKLERVIDYIPPEQIAWRPERDAISIIEMLRHLWVSEEGTRRVALQNDFSYYETRVPKGLRAAMGTPETLEAERANLGRVHRETLAAVGAWPLERFEEERVHEGLKFRRKVYTLLLSINEHTIHHRAQLMTYLRLLGHPIPEDVARR